MKLLLFSLAGLSVLTASATGLPSRPGLHCQAIHRTLNAQNETVETSSTMHGREIAGGQRRFETDLAGRFFVLTEDKANGDLFAQITQAPHYEKGVVHRGATDSQGRFTATEVVGYTIYRLECSRR